VPEDHGRIPSRVPEFALERLDHEALLYHAGLTRAIRLNETAALVWHLCDGVRSAGEIAAMIGEAFPGEEAVRADVEEILGRLASEGAVRFTD
jgi:hypothetical protein